MVKPQEPRAIRLLVLDDDPAIGKTVALMARRLRVECRFCTTAEDFFADFRHWQPTHIALDLAMPDLDGIEALRRLAQLGCKASIVLISGVDGRVLEAAHRAAQNHGLNIAGTLRKPFALASLREFLQLEVDAPGGPQPVMGYRPEPRLTRAMLVRAMTTGHIDVAFQPKVNCSTSSLIGFEALARWTHPKYGPIPPDRFIGLAERTGLCAQLTTIIFDLALDWFGRLDRPDLSLALNLSATLLDDVELADRLAGMCEARGIDVGQVILEVTESSRIYDQTAALDLLVRLRLKGFQLSIDDFGVGYSSLSQLARIPFSELKIDRSFVTNTASSPESRNIVRAIVALGHNLGLTTVAEGVEDLVSFGFLRDVGCDHVQGFLIGRPMRSEAVTAWMAPPDRSHEAGRNAGSALGADLPPSVAMAY